MAQPAVQDIPEGSHLVTRRRTYRHHGIYVGGGRVVHYAGLQRGLQRGPVEEVTIDQFANGRPIELLGCPCSSVESRAVVERARSRLGENDWRLLTNNCEHFCWWCVRGEARSYQVEALYACLFVHRAASRLLPSRRCRPPLRNTCQSSASP